MVTNYYLRKNICKHCSRYDEVHIGKSSAGWKFLFMIDDDHPGLNAWINDIKNRKNRVYDGYGLNIDKTAFFKWIRACTSMTSRTTGKFPEAFYSDGNFDYTETEVS